MPFRIDTEAVGDKKFLQKDKETGKSVYLFLQIVPDEFIRALRKEHARGIRADKIGKLPSGELVERSIDSHRAYAAKAIVGPRGSEGFEVALATQAAADAYAAAIGGGVELRAGETVSLDGKWNEAVKDLTLRVIPGLVERVAEIEKEMRGFESDAEEEATGNFR